MERRYFSNILRISVLLLLLGTGMSCDNREISEGITERYEPVDVSAELQILEYQNKDMTRTTPAALTGDMGVEENAIHNLTVFQFDGAGEDANPLVVLRYMDNGLDNLNLGLMQPKSDPDKTQFLFIVANAGEQLQDFTGTYGELKQKMVPVNNSGISDGIMIMTASLATAINASKNISLLFKRKLAKINVTCFVDAEVSFTPARLQLRNVPKSVLLEKGSQTIIPMAFDDYFQNYQSVTENITNGHTWYMPENQRGKGNAGKAEEKTAESAPAGQGEYCTYVELSGFYQEDGTSKLVSYKVYLGADNITDYNVKANRVYNVNLVIKGIETSDRRLTVETLPAAKSPANCYMVVPGTTVVIDMLKEPGTASNIGINYKERMGSEATISKIKSIGIVWQTENTPDGLIQDLTYLQEVGQAMFRVTAGAAGNLLLAAYSEPAQKGEILWSWHIWVTDYQPEKWISGNTDVPGGNVYTISSVTWMDRDLGATSATAGAATAIGYAYQWGRKDPFPLSTDIANVVLRPLYDSDGAYLRSGPSLKNTDSKDVLLASVQEPDVFFLNTGTAVSETPWWKPTGSEALWVDDAVTKTMFDPCPAGWKIPPYSVTSAISGVNLLKDQKGAYVQTVLWFPMAAYLSFDSGTIGQMGGTCVHWFSKKANAYEINGSKNNIARHCGNGFIGRCVKIQSTN